MDKESFTMQPWMWFLLIVAMLLLFFHFDPVGDFLDKTFGEGANKWAIILTIVITLMISILFGARKKQ